jgi:ubiquinone/menaquinone biosynthesis C-methylase UbiE
VIASLRRRLFAAVYDRCSSGEEAVLAPIRQRIVGQAHGDVLEIGAGTGVDLAFYAPDARLTVFEANPWMAARLKQKAASRGREVRVDMASGPDLPYADAQFDSVVVTMVLCSVTRPAHVLAEIRRVLRPGGSLYFLEHVAAPDERVRRWQRRLNPLQRFLADGCELDRDTASTIRDAGFAAVDMEVLDPAGLASLTRHMICGVARA